MLFGMLTPKRNTMKRNLNEILFAIYVSLVFSLVYTGQFALAPVYLLILFVIFFVVFYFLSHPLFSIAGRINSQKTEVKKTGLIVTAAFIVSFIYLGLWFYYYYPGWFSGDSEMQLNEAVSGIYTDWHPALHTLLCFTLPLKLTGGWKGSIVLFQIIWFSLALSYMVKTFLRHGNLSFATISYILILFNPVTGAIIKQPWKDVTLAIFAIFMSCYALNIFFDGDWIKKPLNLILTSLVTAAATIIRHNAVLFTLPLAVAMVHYIKGKKFKVIYPVLAATVFVLIKGPLYSSLNVTNPGSRVTETMGLPMIIIGETVKESPELLDDDVLDFAYSIAPKEKWDEFYTSGDFNNIKFNGDINTNPIEDAGTAGVLGYMLSCFISSPKYALKGLIDGTKMVYAVSGDITWSPEFIPPKLLSPILSSPLKYVILYVGLGNLAVVFFSLQRKNGWFSIPLLCHNFGTMLLLTGPDYRFFYLTYPVTWIILFHLFFKDKKVTPIGRNLKHHSVLSDILNQISQQEEKN